MNGGLTMADILRWLGDNVDTLEGNSPTAFILEVCIQGENGVRQIGHAQGDDEHQKSENPVNLAKLFQHT